MTTYGRFDPVPVERFSGANWKGMRAVITCGTSDKETGFHAAAGECLWAVLSNNARSIVASTDGDVDWQKDADVILKSLRFTK
jgi:hypothetical protein